MPWEVFERAASGYEQWYTSRRGQRADRAESALLARLLSDFPQARTVVEVGCGTGHFTRQMQTRGMRAVGLDRAEGMLRQMRARTPVVPAVLADAHRLPFRNHAVDLTVFITTLEFLEDPLSALSEAVRITCQGMIVMVLNRWSLGGFSRRWGRQARRAILGQARDFSRRELERMVRDAAGARWGGVWWASTLLPDGLWRAVITIPAGDVIGMGIRLV
ncbi:MAG: class I SAM-dependent methyltransferase [Nitrospirota bacterium]